VLPTTDGREIRLRRITEPTAEQKSLLQQLGLTLAERLKGMGTLSEGFERFVAAPLLPRRLPSMARRV
jgi:hypothetical protein